MRYRDTIRSAIDATWKSKWLWVLSLLTITPLTTVTIEGKLASNVVSAISSPDKYFFLVGKILSGITGSGISAGAFLGALAKTPGAALSFILAMLFVVIMSLFAAWVVVNAQSIIVGTLGNHRRMPFSLAGSLAEVTPFWKTVLLLNVLLLSAKLLVISYLLLLSTNADTAAKNALLWILAISGILGLMLLSFTTRFAIFKAVLERLSFTEALLEGFAIAKRRFLNCFEFSFILFTITLLILALTIFIIISILPEDILSLSLLNVLFIKEGWRKLLLIALVVLFFFFIISLLLLFQYAGWLEWYASESEAPRSFLLSLFYFIKRKVSRA